MAQQIVRDSQIPVFVKECSVLNTNVVNDFVVNGAIRGLVGFTPRVGQDGNYWTTVDTAAEIRFAGDTNVWTNGQQVFWNTSTKAIATAAGAGIVSIGYATRAKGATAGNLFVQLVPQAV